MIDKIFLDSNVVVYLFDKSERQKQSRIKKLIAQHITQSKIYLSVQVINEFVIVTSKKIAFPITASRQKEIIELLNDLFSIVPLNYITSLRALELSVKYKLSYWDSLIISSAIENMCNILFTEDMQNGLIIEDKLKIVNPFS